MRWAGGLIVGLALFLAGCDNQAQTAADSELKTLRARVSSVGRENDNLKASIDTLKAENTSMARKMQALTTENRQLKRDLELARAAAAPAPAAPPQATAATANIDTSAAPSTGIEAQARAVPRPPAVPAGESPVVAQERSIAELEARIKEALPRVVEARSKIIAVSRSTVDQATPVPGGAVIQNDIIYRRESMIVAPYYRLVPIGPVVRKGDFRTQAEKAEALHQAKDTSAPLEQELKRLQDELAAAKVNLLKLKTPAQPLAQPADTPAPVRPAP